MWFRKIVVALVATLSVGCVVEEGYTPIGEDQQDNTAMLGTLPVKDYFYQYDQDPTGDSFEPFGFLDTSFEALPRHEEFTLDEDRVPTVELYLLETGRYHLIYQEATLIAGGLSLIAGKTIKEGDWAVKDSQLILAGLARATQEFGGAPTLRLQFEVDLQSAGLKGNSVSLGYSYGSLSLASQLGTLENGVCDVELGEFCGYDEGTDFDCCP